MIYIYICIYIFIYLYYYYYIMMGEDAAGHDGVRVVIERLGVYYTILYYAML